MVHGYHAHTPKILKEILDDLFVNSYRGKGLLEFLDLNKQTHESKPLVYDFALIKHYDYFERYSDDSNPDGLDMVVRLDHVIEHTLMADVASGLSKHNMDEMSFSKAKFRLLCAYEALRGYSRLVKASNAHSRLPNDFREALSDEEMDKIRDGRNVLAHNNDALGRVGKKRGDPLRPRDIHPWQQRLASKLDFFQIAKTEYDLQKITPSQNLSRTRR